MSHGFRALVIEKDHSLSLLQQGDIVWSREDGLAEIIDATSAELPLERDGVSELPIYKITHKQRF